ncbi:MAG: hypothetical protein C0478_06745 [Planctomyces sp.]|nr:hypothetical protein [Planctomyces sp.]
MYYFEQDADDCFEFSSVRWVGIINGERIIFVIHAKAIEAIVGWGQKEYLQLFHRFRPVIEQLAIQIARFRKPVNGVIAITEADVDR